MLQSNINLVIEYAIISHNKPFRDRKYIKFAKMSLVEMTSLVFLGIPRYKVKDDVSWITKVVVESIESREEDAEKLFIHFNQQTL